MRQTTLDIKLRERDDRIYSAGDRIEGWVRFVVEQDASLETMDLALTGRTSTRVEQHPFLSGKAAYDLGEHTFLHIFHTVSASTLRRTNPAQARYTYSIPFSFSVPEKLHPNACQHAPSDDEVVGAHLTLPPTFGDGEVFINDVTPKRARIAYSIEVQVRLRVSNGSVVVLKKSKPILIVPKTFELSQILVEKGGSCVQDRRVYRMISGNGSGQLIATVYGQPSWVQHQPATASQTTPVNNVIMDLEFDPTDGELPPKINAIIPKLHSYTFFGALPFDTIPRPEDITMSSPDHTHYVKTTDLHPYSLAAVSWMKGSRDHRKPSAAHGEVTSYQTSLQIPLQLPLKGKENTGPELLTPTFTSCLISRVYSVEIKISYTPVVATGSISKYLLPRRWLVLRVPLQVEIMSQGPMDVIRSRMTALSIEEAQLAGMGRGADVVQDPPPAYTARWS